MSRVLVTSAVLPFYVVLILIVNYCNMLQVNDEKVISGSYDKTLKVWDIKTGLCKMTLR